MKTIFKYIKNFLNGWNNSSVHVRPQTFWKYFIYYPLNWSWTLGSLLFIGLFLHGAQKYNAPIFNILSLIPLLMLIYNFISEYFAFKKYGYEKLLVNIFYGASALVLFVAIALLFIN